jgi:ABC-2 type transport system permease protein/lipopolysaccharide transport system permease protein
LEGRPVLLEIRGSNSQFSLAVADLAAAVQLRPLWIRLGWNDILYRYRRSTLGPFWSTANMAITVIALGLVYSQIFNVPIRQLLPYVCAGLIVWSFISSIMLDAGALFSGSESYIKQIRLPYSLHACRFVFGKVILFAHDLPIYIALILYFGAWPGAVALYAIPGFLLLVFNAVLISLTIGMASARFRDIPRIIASFIQVAFLITPIIWTPDLLGPRTYLAYANPLFHLIEIVRAPMLGSLPSVQTVTATLALTAMNLVATTFFFVRFRGRIAYWI